MRHDPPRIVYAGVLWRDMRPMADLYREETPAVEVLRDPHFWLLLGMGLLVLFGGLPYLRRP